MSFGKKISVGMAQPHLGTNRNHRKVQGVFSEMQVNKFEQWTCPFAIDWLSNEMWRSSPFCDNDSFCPIRLSLTLSRKPDDL